MPKLKRFIGVFGDGNEEVDLLEDGFLETMEGETFDEVLEEGFVGHPLEELGSVPESFLLRGGGEVEFEDGVEEVDGGGGVFVLFDGGDEEVEDLREDAGLVVDEFEGEGDEGVLGDVAEDEFEDAVGEGGGLGGVEVLEGVEGLDGMKGLGGERFSRKGLCRRKFSRKRLGDRRLLFGASVGRNWERALRIRY